MKFLHTADWQIGRTYNFFKDGDGNDPGASVANARFEVVAKIAALAREENVDAVLVAGDVFDKQGLADNTLRRLFNAMADFAGRWILLPGNHDAAFDESVWARVRRLGIAPANVTLALQPGVQVFAELGFALIAAPLTQRQTHRDLTEAFDAWHGDAGLIRIGLAHGSVAGVLPESADSPNPIAADRAVRARLDYLALGDWHGTYRVDARTWYSGTPEQDRFKANDHGNVLLVEIDAPGAEPRVTPRRVGRYRWQERAVEIRMAGDVDTLESALRDCGDSDVLKLALSGLVDLATAARLREVLDAARARAHVLDTDLSALRLEPTAADLASLQLDGPVADVLADLQKLQTQSDQAEVASEALKLLIDFVRREGRPA